VVDPWPSGGIEIAFEASEAECRALARRFDLVALRRFTGHARLERNRGGTSIRLTGELEADIVQSCIVSLEDVPARIAETFRCLFTPALEPDDMSWDDDVELLEGSEVDLGEIFAQQLGVALEPYPRAEGAEPLATEGSGPNISHGDDEPAGALAVAIMDGMVARTARPRQGRG
jgi:uncharacterized metal-binding protein YceD (DUF177 family)